MTDKPKKQKPDDEPEFIDIAASQICKEFAFGALKKVVVKSHIERAFNDWREKQLKVVEALFEIRQYCGNFPGTNWHKTSIEITTELNKIANQALKDIGEVDINQADSVKYTGKNWSNVFKFIVKMPSYQGHSAGFGTGEPLTITLKSGKTLKYEEGDVIYAKDFQERESGEKEE